MVLLTATKQHKREQTNNNMSKITFSLDHNDRAIVNNSTHERIHPACFTDLAPYYSYLLGTKGERQSQNLLRDVFHGEKVISNMIASSHAMHLTYENKE